MESEGYFRHIQDPAICPYPDPDQSSPCPPLCFLKIQLNIILLSRPGSSKWPLYLRFSHQNPVCIPCLLHTYYMLRPSHSSRFNHPNNIWWGDRALSSSLCSFLHPPVTSSLIVPNIFLSTLVSKHLQPTLLCQCVTKSHTHTKQQAELLFCIS